MSSPAVPIWGPIFIGVIFNVMLYGVILTQVFLYSVSCKRDRTWLKLFVAVLFACDTLNCAFDISLAYAPLITSYGDLSALEFDTWLLVTDPVMTGIIALMTQMFFAWRVKVLTHNWFLVVLIAFCSFCQFLGAIGTGIAGTIVTEFVYFQKFEVIVIVWLAFSAVADTIIAISLVWYLRKHKTGFASTDDVLNKIIRMTVQTGVVTALCATIDLILFLSIPTGVHLIFNLPLSKLYTNCLLSSLNSRRGWRYTSGVDRSSSAQDSRFVAAPGPGTNPRAANTVDLADIRNHPQQLRGFSGVKSNQEVFIDVETFEMTDHDPDRKGAPARYPASLDA